MKEYVLTLSVRDSAHPCGPDEVLLEAGQSDPLAFAEAVGNLADVLRAFRSPEKAARAMRAHKQALLLPNTKG